MKNVIYFISALLVINFSWKIVTAQSEDAHFDFETRMTEPNANYYEIVHRGDSFYVVHPDTNEDGALKVFEPEYRNICLMEKLVVIFTKR